jgi:hypothetical protein
MSESGSDWWMSADGNWHKGSPPSDWWRANDGRWHPPPEPAPTSPTAPDGGDDATIRQPRATEQRPVTDWPPAGTGRWHPLAASPQHAAPTGAQRRRNSRVTVPLVAGGVVAVLVLGAVAILALVADNGDETPATSTTVPPCAQERHLVAFDIHGTVTTDEAALGSWLTDPSDEPEPRPGAAEVVAAYRERGYEILYTTGTPTNAMLGGEPAADALTGWLARHQFPTGEGTGLHTWDVAGDESVELTDELLRLQGEGVSADAGYTNNDEDVHAYTLGGVPPERVFTLGTEAAEELGSSAIPADDLLAHLATVQALPKICESG